MRLYYIDHEALSLFLAGKPLWPLKITFSWERCCCCGSELRKETM